MPSRICTCLTAATAAGQLATARLQEAYSDLYETRLDFVAPSEWNGLVEAVLGLGKPLVLTVRRQSDGGAWPDIEEAERIRQLFGLVRRWGAHEGIWLDLDASIGQSSSTGRLDAELDQLADEFRGLGGRDRLIRSVHRFESADRQEWRSILERLRGLAAGSVAKLALAANSTADLAEIVRLAQSSGGQPQLVFGMGEFGLPSRILSARLGNLWTYATPAGERSAAPGQLSPQTLDELYRFRQIESSWKIFGIFGDPISHSKSPEYHNRVFAREGSEAVYLPFRVDNFAEGMELAELLEIQGLSVTVPHKESALAEAFRREAAAAAVGAANTLVRSAGKWQAWNTDVAGFMAPLEGFLVSGSVRSALVLGAGGAARAAAFGLASRGLTVRVANRTVARAEALVEDLRGVLKLPGDSLSVCQGMPRGSVDEDLVVQTTSVGLDGAADPAPELEFGTGQVAYDIIYDPERTPFLRRAEAAGARVLNGMPMFEGQAEAQAVLFLAAARGKSPSIDPPS